MEIMTGIPKIMSVHQPDEVQAFPRLSETVAVYCQGLHDYAGRL
jgi:hypothetical protein